MLSMAFTFLVAHHFLLLIIILCYIQPRLAARQLEDISPSSLTGNYEPPVPGTVQIPPPTPVTNVNNTGETRNIGGHGSAHGQIISINNKTTSEGGTITGQNGKPSIVANNDTGSQTGTIYGPNGKPQIKAGNTTSSQTAIVNGSDGKPQYEVEKFDNGTSVITFFGSDGKPSFHMTYQAPSGNENAPNSFWTAPPGFPFPPPN